ncbi:hypothetical protein CF386_08690 [Paraphotobacterium marinum]|uniref:Antitoxin Xre/MbcA/ParS-like toxin-binding domain-containing protein n=1 Tax=Paraphotobacterium marinum TaxID=1755811 RepID=A0A220VFX6_9GAMM|nr:hypothetical protein [Paraphotobacterium marinum]ASK79136.1 hypothetical protein CF386_08690 [Paraphotobacterium marinum]
METNYDDLSVSSNLKDEDFKNITKMICKLFSLWNITETEQANLLGHISPSELHKYQQSDAWFHSEQDISRAVLLLNTHKNLRILYPQNSVCYGFVKRPNERLKGSSPLEIMLDFGTEGIEIVYKLTQFYLAR